MVIVLLVLSGLFLSVLLFLQIRSYRKLKSQTKLMFIQSQEIKKQMQELQQQNVLLEQLNNEKQLIISIVSHDFKGPFNRIFALAQLLLLSGDNFTDEQRDYLGKIHQIVVDGLNMLRNLLDERKLEEKGFHLNLEKLNVSATLASLVKHYSAVAAKKRIEIHFEAPAQLFLVTDKMCLIRIADNLVSNAIKFSPPQKHVVVSVLEKAGGIEFRVQDQGPGITAGDQSKLFQKYQRLTSRPTGGESSTGLGLYLAHAMANKMKGEIHCVSEEGQGATFVVQVQNLTRDKVS